MSYNNREWDRGKDSHWNDGYPNDYSNEGYSGWGHSDHRSHIRHREDDYTADPKRRKYNDGVCSDSRSLPERC